MSQPETAQVAAALTADILSEFVQNGDDNAAQMLSEIQPEVQPVAAPQAPVVSSPTPAADAAPEAPYDPTNDPDVEVTVVDPPVLDFTPQLDEEYRALIEEPDFDEEARAEIAAEHDPDTYDPGFDPDAAAADRAKDKRIKFLEDQLVKSNKGKWVSEAERSFPLLKTYFADELREIDATSRRGFAREAAKLNDRYTRKFAPVLQEVVSLKQQAKTEALAEARTEAAHQWGLPVAEPSGSGPAVSEQQRVLQEAREQGKSLHERLKILAGITPPI